MSDLCHKCGLPYFVHETSGTDVKRETCICPVELSPIYCFECPKKEAQLTAAQERIAELEGMLSTLKSHWEKIGDVLCDENVSDHDDLLEEILPKFYDAGIKIFLKGESTYVSDLQEDNRKLRETLDNIAANARSQKWMSKIQMVVKLEHIRLKANAALKDIELEEQDA